MPVFAACDTAHRFAQERANCRAQTLDSLRIPVLEVNRVLEFSDT